MHFLTPKESNVFLNLSLSCQHFSVRSTVWQNQYTKQIFLSLLFIHSFDLHFLYFFSKLRNVSHTITFVFFIFVCWFFKIFLFLRVFVLLFKFCRASANFSSLANKVHRTSTRRLFHIMCSTMLCHRLVTTSSPNPPRHVANGSHSSGLVIDKSMNNKTAKILKYS